MLSFEAYFILSFYIISIISSTNVTNDTNITSTSTTFVPIDESQVDILWSRYENYTCSNLIPAINIFYNISQTECESRCLSFHNNSIQCTTAVWYEFIKPTGNDVPRCYLFGQSCELTIDTTKPVTTSFWYYNITEDMNCENYPSNWKDNYFDTCDAYELFNFCDYAYNSSTTAILTYQDTVYGFDALKVCCGCNGGLLNYDNQFLLEPKWKPTSILNIYEDYNDFICETVDVAATTNILINENGILDKDKFDFTQFVGICQRIHASLYNKYKLLLSITTENNNIINVNNIYSDFQKFKEFKCIDNLLLYNVTICNSTDYNNLYPFIIDLEEDHMFINNNYIHSDTFLYHIPPTNIQIKSFCSFAKLLETIYPTKPPTKEPTFEPTLEPTVDPTIEPTSNPTQPTLQPSVSPSTSPTYEPTIEPTNNPTNEPTTEPTSQPTQFPSKSPTYEPTTEPTNIPTTEPTTEPSIDPTKFPSEIPTYEPTNEPTNIPTNEPTTEPTVNPTQYPSNNPTKIPTENPSKSPTFEPTIEPTTDPTKSPSNNPSVTPSKYPSTSPTFEPTIEPTTVPTKSPSNNPSVTPSKYPSTSPTKYPSISPTEPTSGPSFEPTIEPTMQPTEIRRLRRLLNHYYSTPYFKTNIIAAFLCQTAYTKSPTISPTKYPTIEPTEYIIQTTDIIETTLDIKESKAENNALSGGAIVGIVIGIFVFCILIIILMYCFVFKKIKNSRSNNDNAVRPPSGASVVANDDHKQIEEIEMPEVAAITTPNVNDPIIFPPPIPSAPDDESDEESEEKKDPEIDYSFKTKRMKNWTNEEILNWVKCINLGVQWKDKILNVIVSNGCTGEDIVELKVADDVGDAFEIVGNKILCKRIIKEIKNFKPDLKGVDTFNINLFINNSNGGEKLTLDEEFNKSDTIFKVKTRYKIQAGIDFELKHIHFKYKKKELLDIKTLSQCGIKNDNHLIDVVTDDVFTIHLFARDNDVKLNSKVSSDYTIKQIKEIYINQSGVYSDSSEIHFKYKNKTLLDNKTLKQCGITDDKHLITVRFGAGGGGELYSD